MELHGFTMRVQFQKISILPPHKGLEFPGEGTVGVLEDQKI